MPRFDRKLPLLPKIAKFSQSFIFLTRHSHHHHHLLTPPTLSPFIIMSAFRALRQTALTSTRALAARPTSSLARCVLPALAARAALIPATRAFSLSARRLGEGACTLNIF